MTIEGPLLRWVSKTEEITTLVSAPPPPPPPQTIIPPAAPSSYNSQYSYVYPTANFASSATPYVSPSFQAYIPRPPTSYYPPPQPSSSQMTFVYHSFPPVPSAVVAPPPPPPPPSQSSPPATAPYIPAPQPPPLIEKVETVAKNYVIHQSSQMEGASRPLWKETMAAMFGDHVQWDELKVYTGKARPLCRWFVPSYKCIIR